MVDFIKVFINSKVWVQYEPFLISLILGGLIGTEREFKKQREKVSMFGGIRTFMLISLLGTLSAYAGKLVNEMVVPVSVASLIAFLIASQFIEKVPSITSRIAALITFLVGVICYTGNFQIASVIAVTVLFVLTFREQMHEFVKHLTIQDLFAFLKFAAVTVVIYPLLPDRTIGPYGGVNPRDVWAMVVVISTIDFIGYALTKFIGSRRGIVITGLIGGLVSSTAVTVTLSPLFRENPQLINNCAAGIIGASTIMFIRIFVLASIVNLNFSAFLLIPCAAATVLGLLFAYYVSKQEETKGSNIRVHNPFELSNAFKFGAFYGFILFLSKSATKVVGALGLYAISAISGLSDVDAITLSTSKIFTSGYVDVTVAVVTILIAATVNTLFKWFLTLWMGGRELFRKTSLGFILLTVGELLGALALMITAGQG